MTERLPDREHGQLEDWCGSIGHQAAETYGLPKFLGYRKVHADGGRRGAALALMELVEADLVDADELVRYLQRRSR